ncbi:MAG: hypothetical protein AB2993_01100 [Candidatus Symbiodolus clandestinus]
MNRKKTAHSRSRGITSLETLGFLTALIMIASLCASIVQNYYKKTRAVSAARHLKKVNDAACAYLKDNFSQLKSHAITNKTIKKQTSQEKILIIKLQQLIDQGYLPNGFSKKSVYSQEYRIQIRVPIEKRKGWQVWTTTEKGDRIDRHAWTVIGSLLKYHGFYRSEPTKKIINGLRQLSDNSIIEIDPGHIAFLQVIDNAKLYTTDSFIYRKLNDNDSPRPMQTSLRLDKNSITFKKSSKEVKLNNQSLELKNRTYIANLELLNKNKENIPTIHLKESHSSDSKSLTITPSTLKISRNSLFNNRIEYDISNKKAKIIFTESESQLHWNPYWNHIPYHQNNDSQDTLTTANKICHYGIKVASREALGRLFIIESKKNIQIFICGKNQTKHGIEAYNLFSVQKPLKKHQSFKEIDVIKKTIKGFILRAHIQNAPSEQFKIFIKKVLSDIYIIKRLEEETYHKRLLKSMNNPGKPIFEIITTFEKKSIETFITNNLLTQNFLKHTSYDQQAKNITERFIDYMYNIKNNKDYKYQENSTHKETLKTIINNLKQSLSAEKFPNNQTDKRKNDFINNQTTTDYLNTLKECSSLTDSYWMPTLYVLSHDISRAYPNNDHPFFETLYEEAEPAIVSNSKANGLYKD